MGVEENDDKTTNLLEVQPEVAEEPIEQVFSQEPGDIKSVEPSIESEDQQRFEETAKFEEDLLLVHHATIKDLQKQVSQMHRKIATIDSSRKSTRVKTTGKKTTLKKKASSSKKSKKKIGQKKSRKR